MNGKRWDASTVRELEQRFVTELTAAVLKAEKLHGKVARTRLAATLNVSVASVYAYLRGTTLPSSALLDQLLIELRVAPEDARELATLRDSVEIAQRGASARSRARRVAAPPVELPRDIGLLYGRQTELDRIHTALTRDAGGVVVCVVSGLGGVGKTALAVRTARTLAAEFADGCLFLDLHGYSSGAVTTIEEAADKLLRQLGLPAESIPPQPDRRAETLRAQLRDKRVLLVLDNALDTAHVLPLLPVDGDSAVLITSRSNLNALDDAVRVRVAPLSAKDTSALLSELAADAAESDREAGSTLESIAAQCRGLPVAVRIAAAVLRSEAWPVPPSTADADLHIAVFHDGERGIEELFAHSVARLPSELAETFLLLGVHCGPTFDADAVAALAGIDDATTRRRLRRLIEANLLDAPTPGRYSCHDLLRIFARDTARSELEPSMLAQAITRMIDHYLARMDAADRLLTPHRHRLAMTPTSNGSRYTWPDYQQAVDGLTADRDNLAGAAQCAFDNGLDEQCWQIAFALRGFVFIANDTDLWIGTHDLALRAAQRAGNDHAQAITRNNLGLGLLTRGDIDAAAEMYEQARALFERIGDAHGEHTSIAHQAWVHFQRGDHEQAYRASTTALDYVTRFGTPRNTAILLRDTALIEVALGRPLDAVPKLLEAQEMFAAFGLLVDEAMACNVLGDAYLRLDAPGQAHEAFERAIELAELAHSLLERARGHEGSGRVAAGQQDWDAARRHWRVAHDDFAAVNDTVRAQRTAARLAAIADR